MEYSMEQAVDHSGSEDVRAGQTRRSADKIGTVFAPPAGATVGSLLACRGLDPGHANAQCRPFVREDIGCLAGTILLKPMCGNRTSFGATPASGFELGGPSSAAILVDRRRVLLGFATLCDHIAAEHHANGTVHGDLTPASTLATGGRFVAIDPIGTAFGDVAPGGTLEWAAPEQLMQQPVSVATDVFSLTLLAVALLDGLMFGRVTEHIIALREKPTSPPTLHTAKLRVIEDPSLIFGAAGLAPAAETASVLRAALHLVASSRPTLAELRDILVAESCRMTGPGCWVGLSRGFGNGMLHRNPAAQAAGELAPIAGLAGQVDFFWGTKVVHK